MPTGYDWYAESGQPVLEPPNGETVVNWWGQVYVDETGVIPPNVRVAVQGVTLLALYESSDEWIEVQGWAGLGGGAWAEDFHSTCDASAYDVRSEQDGSFSFATALGCNAHYWPSAGQAPIDGAQLRAAVVVGFTRLVPTDPAQPIGESTYINGVGADWRVPGGGCPQPSGSSVPICNAIGGGRFIRVTPEWRTMVFSSISEAQLAALPLPPLAYFEQPDGSYFR